MLLRLPRENDYFFTNYGVFLDPSSTLLGQGAHKGQPKSTQMPKRNCLLVGPTFIEIPEPLRRGVYVVWTQYLPVRLQVGLVPKSPLWGTVPEGI